MGGGREKRPDVEGKILLLFAVSYREMGAQKGFGFAAACMKKEFCCCLVLLVKVHAAEEATDNGAAGKE
jgi:hypothetical protein